ncbi:terpene synthase family protein [Actinomadura pelletieri]|uniref:terpene synthase family protein n=1 Tax=Actinomadura pelletieri TaxID=111805 RepID=UPI001FE30950|nr:terpene synthase family protein [Actinomadura pelletieri]
MVRVVDISLLLSMTDRVPALAAAPSAMHPESWRLGAQVETWARGRGLVLGDPDTSPLGRARCERLAARVFPSVDLAAVDLFARWLTWTLALDDTLDHPPLSDSGSAVHALYDDLLRAMRRGHARPGARPLETALVELWDVTSTGMSREWRRRFMLQLEAHRDGCAEEAVNRRVRQVPTEAQFASLRRRACGPFLYDLVEPVLGVELPARLLRTPSWKTLAHSVADVVAWSNDVASHDLEAARGDVHDLPAVLAHARGVAPGDADTIAALVAGRITDRLEDAWTAARRLPEMLDRLELTVAQRAAAAQVVKVLLDVPRAHIDWLAESGRYEPPGASPAPGRLDALASLR